MNVQGKRQGNHFTSSFIFVVAIYIYICIYIRYIYIRYILSRSYVVPINIAVVFFNFFFVGWPHWLQHLQWWFIHQNQLWFSFPRNMSKKHRCVFLSQNYINNKTKRYFAPEIIAFYQVSKVIYTILLINSVSTCVDPIFVPLKNHVFFSVVKHLDIPFLKQNMLIDYLY